LKKQPGSLSKCSPEMEAQPKPPPQPDPDEELAAAIQAATTLDELKDALLGKFEKAKVKGKAV
jgi:hypothetical protein